jgi:hypothetical protein
MKETIILMVILIVVVYLICPLHKKYDFYKDLDDLDD